MKFERKKSRFRWESAVLGLMRLLICLALAALALLVGRAVVRGIPAIVSLGPGFFSGDPQTLHRFYDETGQFHRLTEVEYAAFKEARPDAMELAKESAELAGGGILAPLIGTMLVMVTSFGAAITLGLGAALFLSEYPGRGRFVRAVRFSINQLAGAPSIVLGLFGMAFFCWFFPVITAQPAAAAARWEIPGWMIPRWASDPGYRVFLDEGGGKSAGFRPGIGITMRPDGLYYRVLSDGGDVIKQVSPGQVAYRAGEMEGILKSLETIRARRDEATPAVDDAGARTAEETRVVRTLIPLLKIGKRLWVSFEGMKPSALAAVCTMACLVFPIGILAAGAALKAVPGHLRLDSLALGATPWRTMAKSVIPQALPGILGAAAWGSLRACGETAPLLLTGMPAEGGKPWALPQHIYLLAGKAPPTPLAEPMQDGAVLTLTVMALALAAASLYLQSMSSRDEP